MRIAVDMLIRVPIQLTFLRAKDGPHIDGLNLQLATNGESQITGPFITGGVFWCQLQEFLSRLESIWVELPQSRDHDHDHAVTRGHFLKLGEYVFQHLGDIRPFVRMVLEVIGLVQSLPGGAAIEIVGLHEQVIVISRAVFSLLIDLQPMELGGRAADGTVSKERGS